jgi:hypothetical protein
MAQFENCGAAHSKVKGKMIMEDCVQVSCHTDSALALASYTF